MKSRPGTTTAALALAAALVLQLAAPAAAACQSATMGACTPSATPQGDCCAGKTCHPVIKQCYPAPRAAGQPCLDEQGYGCAAGLSCDPVFKRCFPSPRKAGQPCTEHSECATGLYCNDYTRRCQAPNAANTKTCHESLPCGTGYSCDYIRNQCFVAPRTDDTPCIGREMSDPAVPNWGCAAGTTCELLVSWECHPLGKLTQACHEYKPCQAGLSCHPYIQKCYSEPRLLNQPCGTVEVGGQQKTFECAENAGLYCDISIGRCVPAAKEGQSCYANKPCASGLSCHPGHQICLPVPRREGQPCIDDGTDDTKDFKCADTNSIGESLSCDMLATMRCVKQQTYKTSKVAGAHCYEGRPCVDGLTCSTSDLKCYNYPRVTGEPCIPGAGEDSLEKCGPGLVCRADTKKCDAPKVLGELCYPGFNCASGYSCVDAFRLVGRLGAQGTMQRNQWQSVSQTRLRPQGSPEPHRTTSHTGFTGFTPLTSPAPPALSYCAHSVRAIPNYQGRSAILQWAPPNVPPASPAQHSGPTASAALSCAPLHSALEQLRRLEAAVLPVHPRHSALPYCS